MAQTQINGGTQIKSGTIPLSALVSGYSIPTSNLTDGASFLMKDGSVTMTGALNMGGFTVQASGTPSNTTDLTTKAYVDAKTAGIGGWHGVHILAASNVTTSGLTAIDGVTPIAGDLILCTAQSTGSQNGPWVAASGSWTRPTWWASAAVVNEGQYFLAAEGTTYKDSKWFCTNVGTITVDTTSTTFVQDSSGATYTFSTGLTNTGGTITVNYGTSGTTAAAGNDSRITGALQTSALGTNVQTALGVNVGSAGAVVVNGGALGTPSTGTLTNCSGLPISGIASLGTGVGTALGNALNGASGLVGYSGALGTPTSGTLTNATGLPISTGLTGAGTGVLTALGVNVGTAGSVVVNGGALGTPSGGTLTNATGLPVSTGISGLGTGVAAALAVATGGNGGITLANASGYLGTAYMPAFTGGDVTSAGGSLSLTVNHTSSTGFCKYTDFVYNETPSGTINGVNATFTLANTPATGSGSVSTLELTLNGVVLEPGAGNDYTLSGSTITMLLVPLTGDKLRAFYMK